MAKGEVRYRLVLDSKDFNNGLKEAGKQAQQFGNDMAGKLGRAGEVLSAMGPAGMVAAAGIGAVTVAVGAVTAAVVAATKGAAEYADNLAALETKTGLSTDALQKMEVAAKLGNTSIEALASATNKMQKGIVDGNENFRKLGLSLADLRKMNPEEQLKATAVAIERIQNPAQKTAAAIAIFGKSGTDSLGALKALAEGAGDLGGALDGKAIKASAEMADKLDLMGTAMERAWLQFGAAIASSPEVQAAIEDITKELVKAAEWMQKHGPEIKAFFGMIAEYARAAMTVVKDLGGWLAKLAPDSMGGEFYRDKLKAARMGTGVSSGGVTVSGDIRFTGAADDAAAKAAAAAAERARAAWQRAAEQARKDWDKFYEEFEKRGRETVWGMEDDIAKRVKAMAPTGNEPDGPIAKLKAYNDMVKAVSEDAKKVDALDAEYAQRADARLLYKIGLVGELGSAFQDLGMIVGGVFGSILGGLGSITQGIGSAMASIRQMKTSGGDLQGMLGKASGALGLAGAAFSVGKIVWGGLKSLFGGKSEEEKAAEAQKIKDTTAQLQSLMDKAKSLKMDQLKGGVSGLAAIFDHLATKTDVAGERFRRLEAFGMDLFRKLKAEGMSTSEAFDALGPSLDAALAGAKANGQELGGTFGQLAQFRQLVQDNAGLVSAVDGLNKLVTAIGLTRDSFATVRPEMMAFYEEMIGKGFTADQAIGEIAPTLFAIREAARAGRIEVDETTKALIAQAEAGGHFDNLKDPMKELVEVQKMMLELWAAIAQMQGVTLPASLREYIATLHQAQSAQSGLGVGGGGGFQNKYDGEDVSYPETPGEAGHGASGYHGILGRGPLPGGGTPLVGHPGEEAYLGPPGGNGGISGGMMSLTTILRINETELGRAQTGMLRKNKGGVSSGTARYGARG